MEDVREGGAGGALVGRDVEFVSKSRHGVADVDDDGMRQATLAEGTVAAHDHVEPPGSQAVQRLFLPFAFVLETFVVEFLMKMAVDEFAPVATIADVVDAKDDEATAERIIGPPAAIIILFDMEEASRLVFHIRNEAFAVIWWV